jgi:hypothetical protein
MAMPHPDTMADLAGEFDHRVGQLLRKRDEIQG